MPCQKSCRHEYGVTLDWPYRGDRTMVPHHLALEISTSGARRAKMSAFIIALHKFFIDLFSILVNNLLIKHVHSGEKRWNCVIVVK